MNQEVLIKTQNLCKSYGKRKVIDKLDLAVEKGEVYGFLGPNGSGKTTTIKLLLGLIHADEGTVCINGYDIRNNFNNAIGKIGAIVETPVFFTYMTGYQNLSYISRFYRGITEKKIKDVLELVNLSDRSGDPARTYSLGMKQRLGIAAALINDPSLVILDEPTNGLDPQGIIEVREMISRLAIENGISFFISSHNLHEIEQVCTSVSVLKQGKLVAQGKVLDLLKSAHEVIDIITPDNEKCLSALRCLPYAKTCENTPNGITTSIEKGFSDRLLAYLVSNNICVKYLVPQNQSLENVFMELTGGVN